MPTVQYFGTLEPRPSPLSQVLMAMQPIPGQLREAVDSFLEFYSTLGPAQRQQLEAAPNFGRMLRLAQIFRPGSVGVDDQGRPRILLSRETLQQEKEQERAEAMNIVAPIAAATPEQQPILIEQRQDELRRAAELYPSIVYRDPATGLYMPAIDRTQALAWQGAMAEIERMEAETENIRETTGALSEERERARREAELQEAQRVIEAIVNAPPEERETLIRQQQDRLEWVQQVRPELVYRDEATGLLRPATDEMRGLQVEATRAGIEQVRAETERTKADTQRILSGIDQAWYSLGLQEREIIVREGNLDLAWATLQEETRRFDRQMALQETEANRIHQRWEAEFGLKREESAAQLAMQKALTEAQIKEIEARTQIAIGEFDLRVQELASLAEFRLSQARYYDALARREETEITQAQEDLELKRVQAQVMLLDAITRQLETIAPLEPTTQRRYLTIGGEVVPLDWSSLMLIYDSIGRGIMGDAWSSDMVADVFTAAMGGTGEAAEGPVVATVDQEDRLVIPGVPMVTREQAKVGRERGKQWLQDVAAKFDQVVANLVNAIVLPRRGADSGGAAQAEREPNASWPPLPEGVTWDDVRRRLLEVGRTGPLSSALTGPVRSELQPVDAYIAQLLEVATPRNMPIQERINLLLDQLEQMGG